MFLLKPKIIVAVAVGFGFIASYAVYAYVQQQQAQVKMPMPVTRQVVMSAANLPMGTMLKAEDLQVKPWPEEVVPESSFQEVQEVVGRVLKSDISAGEVILESKMAPLGSSGGVPGLIPPGMRAMTVAVTVISGVSGFILPKSRVDILATVSLTAQREETTTKTILQNVEVLAIDQTFNKNDDSPTVVKSVTLLVSCDDAEKLALAANEGRLHLALRNNNDPELHNAAGASLSQLIDRPQAQPRRQLAPPPVSPPPPAEMLAPEPLATKKVIEVIRANVRSEITLEQENVPKPTWSKQ